MVEVVAPNLLEVHGVSKSFGGVQAVRDLDIAVEKGAIAAIIGPNGAGKSTAIDLISGFKKPDSGTIMFDTHVVQGKPAYRMSRLGLARTFQTAREWPRLTVMDNMLASAPQQGMDTIWRALFARRRLASKELADRQNARRLLTEFGLFDLRNELAGNLSGGQKRLLEFARIAIARPRMVLLDEPLAGVNPVLQDKILSAVHALNREGITILLIEHNLPWVEAASDRITVMAEGTAIASGRLSELRAHRGVIDAYLGEVVANG